MYNWSVDEVKFKKADPEGYKIWRLEQMINYGLGAEKLNIKDLEEYFHRLHIDERAKKYLEFLL